MIDSLLWQHEGSIWKYGGLLDSRYGTRLYNLGWGMGNHLAVCGPLGSIRVHLAVLGSICQYWDPFASIRVYLTGDGPISWH